MSLASLTLTVEKDFSNEKRENATRMGIQSRERERCNNVPETRPGLRKKAPLYPLPDAKKKLGKNCLKPEREEYEKEKKDENPQRARHRDAAAPITCLHFSARSAACESAAPGFVFPLVQLHHNLPLYNVFVAAAAGVGGRQ